jgi:hypothetical protein
MPFIPPGINLPADPSHGFSSCRPRASSSPPPAAALGTRVTVTVHNLDPEKGTAHKPHRPFPSLKFPQWPQHPSPSESTGSGR